MKFSVLIANYNNAPYIKEAVNSIIDQTHFDWEIIFVDDCSTDNSLEVIKQFSDPKIRIFVNDKNYGCGYTKYRCANEASGEIAAFLDPDDTLAKNAIETMINAYKANPDAVLIYSPHYLCNEKLEIEKLNDRSGQITNNYLLVKDKSITALAAFKLEKYRMTEGINPNLKRSVDQDLYYRLEEVGGLGTFVFIDTPLYFYRRVKGSISSGKNARKAEYWHLLVQESAYKRRKGNSLEVSYKVLLPRWEKYYYSLINEAIKEKNVKKFFFSWCKLIRIDPFSKINVKISFLKQMLSLLIFS